MKLAAQTGPGGLDLTKNGQILAQQKILGLANGMLSLDQSRLGAILRAENSALFLL